jgi:hypothetical protein
MAVLLKQVVVAEEWERSREQSFPKAGAGEISGEEAEAVAFHQSREDMRCWLRSLRTSHSRIVRISHIYRTFIALNQRILTPSRPRPGPPCPERPPCSKPPPGRTPPCKTPWLGVPPCP